MCGIIGYIGPEDALPFLVDGLKRMEYRGYDSAGVALISDGKTKLVKRQGKISNLVEALDEDKPAGHTGIGHTRWATHGVPNQVNAHPHQAGPITIVHNGIIENYADLAKELSAKHGRKFVSETDTEVLAHQIAVERESAGSIEDAVLAALLKVEGTFGLLVMDERDPDKIVAARRGSPLLLGVTDNAMFLASDATAVIGHTKRIVYLDDDEIAICTPTEYRVIDFEAKARRHEEQQLKMEVSAIEKSGYDHFLLKEIMEQPQAVQNILRGRLDFEEGTAHLGGLNLTPTYLKRISRILSVACGSAGFTGLLGKYQIERLTGLPVDIEIGSEFRYRDPALSDRTLGVVISQSGETADTLAAVKEMKRRGVRTLGLVNVVGSTIAREVDGGVYLHCGPEIAVASTKAVTSMMVAQILLGLTIGRSRQLSVIEGKRIATALKKLPGQIQQILDRKDEIREVAKRLAHFDDALFVGRDTLYPIAMEGSLKLKETAYIHSEAYAAGELKHGGIALVDPEMLVVFYHLKNDLYDKSRSNLEEIRARHGHLLVVGTDGDEALKDLAKEVLYIPDSDPITQPILASIPMQLFAYYVAIERGTDVDQPRNLAKSVTVE